MTARFGYNGPMATGSSIAIFLPNWVGDVVMATPAIRAMARHWSGRRIVFVGRRAALATLGPAGEPEDLLELPRGLWAGRRLLKRNGVSRAVLLPNSFRTAMLCWLGGAKRRAGYARDGRGWMLSDRLEPIRDERGRFKPVPTIEYYNALARVLGADATSWRMALPVDDADQAAADAILNEAKVDAVRPVVMLNPGAAFGPSKLWPAERYAVVADELIERRGAQIIINAAPSERGVAAAVAAAMKHSPAVSFAERDNSIGLLKALLRRSDLLITNDTGARHFAAAMETAVVTIFGSTDPTWARIDYPRERQLQVRVPCGPCQRKVCTQPPGDAFHQCMKAITSEMVLAAADDLLDAAAPREAGI